MNPAEIEKLVIFYIAEKNIKNTPLGRYVIGLYLEGLLENTSYKYEVKLNPDNPHQIQLRIWSDEFEGFLVEL